MGQAQGQVGRGRQGPLPEADRIHRDDDGVPGGDPRERDAFGALGHPAQPDEGLGRRFEEHRHPVRTGDRGDGEPLEPRLPRDGEGERDPLGRPPLGVEDAGAVGRARSEGQHQAVAADGRHLDAAEERAAARGDEDPRRRGLREASASTRVRALHLRRQPQGGLHPVAGDAARQDRRLGPQGSPVEDPELGVRYRPPRLVEHGDHRTAARELVPRSRAGAGREEQRGPEEGHAEDGEDAEHAQTIPGSAEDPRTPGPLQPQEPAPRSGPRRPQLCSSASFLRVSP